MCVGNLMRKKREEKIGVTTSGWAGDIVVIQAGSDFKLWHLQTTAASEDVERGTQTSATGQTSHSSSSVRRVIHRTALMSAKLGVLAASCALVWYFMGWMVLIQLILVAIVAYLAAGGGYRWFYVALRTLPRDAA